MNSNPLLRVLRRRFVISASLLLAASLIFLAIQAMLFIAASPLFLDTSLLMWGGFSLFILHSAFAMISYQISDLVGNSYAETCLLVAAAFVPLLWILPLVTLISHAGEQLDVGELAKRDERAVSELMANGVHLDPDPVKAMREIYRLAERGIISEYERERIARLLADEEI